MDQSNFDFWEFLAGLGTFLIGMYQMEQGFGGMAGKTFRNLLQSFTNQRWKAIMTGLVTTAILQSSSLVTLMTLAFLGAGLITLSGAIAVVLGANLGTTATAWIVATLGFKISVSTMSFPFLGIGAMGYLIFKKRPILMYLSMILLGFGLLFLGLEFMKDSIGNLANQLDFSDFQNKGNWLFLLIGIGITAIIQSSSATMVILLSAMHAGIIGLEQGAAIMIGSNIGTTITVGIGAFGGNPDKKRLALSHFIFNVSTGVLVFPFIPMLIVGIKKALPESEILIQVVTFNSFFNFAGILIFFPFLHRLEKWLSAKFKKDEFTGQTNYIKKVSPEITDAALKAIEKEIHALWEKTHDYIGEMMRLNHTPGGNQESIWERIIRQSRNLDEKYTILKQIEDELTAYHIQVQSNNLEEKASRQLGSYMLSIRLLIFSAKNFKDILHNIKAIENTDDSFAEKILDTLKTQSKTILDQLENTLKDANAEEVAHLQFREISNWEGEFFENLYAKFDSKKSQIPISTLTNVGEQVFRGLKNLGAAIFHLQHPTLEVLEFPEPKEKQAT
jgi:phosphate:Na+ symporter